MTQSLLINVFNHAHWYNSLGMRLYFGTVPGDDNAVLLLMQRLPLAGKSTDFPPMQPSR